MDQYHDKIWGLLFIANLCVYGLILYNTFSQRNLNIFQVFNQIELQFHFDVSKILISAVAINTLNLLFALKFPKFYINSSLYIQFLASLVAIAGGLYAAVSDGNLWAFLGVFLILILNIFIFTSRRSYVNFSSILLKNSASVLAKYPSLFAVEFFESVIIGIVILLNTLFFYIAYSEDKETSLFSPLIYFLFSTYWIINTVYYICSMTTAGVVGYELFLEKKNMPRFPVLSSFMRACTKQFGSAALAGLILAVIETLSVLVESLNPKNKRKKNKKNKDDKDDSQLGYIIQYILYYICSIILDILRKTFSYLSSQALILCQIYGISFKNASQQWASQSFNQICDNINAHSIIKTAFVIHFSIINIVSCLIFLFFGFSGFYFVSTFIFSYIIFYFLYSSFTTISNTFILSYAKSDVSFRTNFRDLYDAFFGIN